MSTDAPTTGPAPLSGRILDFTRVLAARLSSCSPISAPTSSESKAATPDHPWQRRISDRPPLFVFNTNLIKRSIAIV